MRHGHGSAASSRNASRGQRMSTRGPRQLCLLFFQWIWPPRLDPTPGRIRDARQTVPGAGSFRIRDTRYWATTQIGRLRVTHSFSVPRRNLKIRQIEDRRDEGATGIPGLIAFDFRLLVHDDRRNERSSAMGRVSEFSERKCMWFWMLNGGWG